MNLIHRFIGFIIRFRLVILIFLVGLSVLSLYKTAKGLQVDNSLSIWFLDDNPNYRAYIDYQNEFGSDEIFIGMIPVANALDSSAIARLEKLHQRVDALGYVNSSFSLAKAKYPIYGNGKLKFNRLYSSERSESGMQSLLNKMPNIKEQLITSDYKNLFFYIQLKPTPLIENNRQEIAPEINNYFQEIFGDNFFLSGAPVLNEAYSTTIYKESMLFGGLTILVISIMLFLLLPAMRYLWVALTCVIVPISILFGFITFFGYPLNMISMLIPTILMVYSVSDVVHIINIYHKEGSMQGGLNKVDLIELSLRKSFIPCFYTTLTTFVGYFALYLSPLPAFKNMAILTCLGLILSFSLVYIFVIIGFSYLSLNFLQSRSIFKFKFFNYNSIVVRLNEWTSKSKQSIIVIFSIVLVMGLVSIFSVRIDTNSLDLLADSKAKRDLFVVEENLNGSSRLQLNVTSKDPSKTMLDAESINMLRLFQNKLENNKLVSSPVSILNIQAFLEQRSPSLFQSNVNKARLNKTIKGSDAQISDFFQLYANDFQTAGVTLNVKELKTSELILILNTIKEDFIATFDNHDYELAINGFSVVFAQLNAFILETQFKSFFAAFFVAFLVLWHFIRSFKTTLLILIPNIVPLAMLAIVMTLFKIPLDVSTAMITPIMIGIAMDDTIHLVYKYKRGPAEYITSNQRIDHAMRYTFGALSATTLALVVGFLIISLSAVPSVAYFGLLCAVTVAFALITDILFLPALLKRFDN